MTPRLGVLQHRRANLIIPPFPGRRQLQPNWGRAVPGLVGRGPPVRNRRGPVGTPAFPRCVSPHGRVEGRTWELSFDLPWPKNGGSSPKKKPVRARCPKRTTVKTAKKANPKRRQKPTPTPVDRTQSRQEYERERRQTPERREYCRLKAQEHRQKAKEAGLCRGCPSPAIPGQTRCETCAEKNRVYRRKWEDSRKADAVLEAPSPPNPQ